MVNQDRKNDKKTSEVEWEFKLETSKTSEQANQSTLLELKKSKKRSHSKSIKTSKLRLDESSLPKVKSRTGMSQNLEELENLKYKDIYHYAPLLSRASAAVIDFILIGIFVKIASSFKPLFIDSFHLFIGENAKVFFLSDVFLGRTFLATSLFLAALIFLVFPLAFYNSSFGKKWVGLRVRGTQYYTLSLFQSFMREIFLKPLSIILIFGFITPFFTKKRQSIHDMVLNTFVIKD